MLVVKTFESEVNLSLFYLHIFAGVRENYIWSKFAAKQLRLMAARKRKKEKVCHGCYYCFKCVFRIFVVFRFVSYLIFLLFISDFINFASERTKQKCLYIMLSSHLEAGCIE